MKRLESYRWALLPAVLLLLLGGLIGCSSDDPVTPNEQDEVTAEDVAHQAGYLAYAVSEVLQDFDKAVPAEQHMTTPLNGYYMRDAGTGSTRYYTEGDQSLGWIPEGFNVMIAVTFDITVADGTPKVADGSGDLLAGSLNVTFDLNSVGLTAGGAPISGTMLVASGNINATVTFAPGTATVQIGTQSWTVDMTDGTIS